MDEYNNLWMIQDEEKFLEEIMNYIMFKFLHRHVIAYSNIHIKHNLLELFLGKAFILKKDWTSPSPGSVQTAVQQEQEGRQSRAKQPQIWMTYASPFYGLGDFEDSLCLSSYTESSFCPLPLDEAENEFLPAWFPHQSNPSPYFFFMVAIPVKKKNFRVLDEVNNRGKVRNLRLRVISS